MQKKQIRWSVLAFGILMSVIMVASLATPLLLQFAQNRSLRQQAELQEEQAVTPVPTFPPPIPVTDIGFERRVLQANGLFTVAVPQPPEWDTVESRFEAFANRAQVIMRNPNGVVEAYVERPAEPPTTTEDVSTIFSQAALGTSWRNYSSWAETARSVGADRLTIDFELEQQSRTFVARQQSWTDGEWVYSVRVVTPENATDQLVFTLDGVSNSLEPLKQFAGTPFEWDAYYDGASNHLLRYPDAWTITDAADGRPASFEATDGTVAVRVETVDADISDESGASAYVEGLANVTEVLSVQPREAGDGYSVAYRFANFDGEGGSGLAVLLNSDESTHVADARVLAAEADLIAAADEFPDVTGALQTFSIIGAIEVAEPPPLPSAGPGGQPFDPSQFGGAGQFDLSQLQQLQQGG